MSKLKLVILNLSSFPGVKRSQSKIILINKLNNTKRASSVATFDFSILYTNIPNNKLKNNMKEAIVFCLKNRQYRYITITKYGATWVNIT